MSSSLTKLQNPIKETNSKAPSIPKTGLTYLKKQSLRQSIRFMPPSLSFHNSTLSIDGKPTRAQTHSAFRHYHKTGHCSLYIEGLNEQLVNLYTKDVSKIRNLRHFSIHFCRCWKLTSKSIKLMAKSLGMMKGLKSIKIDFQDVVGVSDDAVQELIKAISLCKMLEKLQLKFLVCRKITDSALLGLEYLQRLVYLKSLVFHLNHSNGEHNITERGIKKFEEMLSGGHLKQLEVFDLNLFETAPRKETSLEVIAKAIGHLSFYKNLKVFKLNLMKWTQTNFGLLANSLVELKNLRSLELNFEQCDNFQDREWRKIYYSIRELTSLRCLLIKIGYCKQITDIGYIENMLYNLKELSSFSLDLSSLQDVSDNAVEAVGRGLGALQNLKSVYLNFQKCWDIGITDEGTIKLFEGIAHNNGLEELHLQLDHQKNLGIRTFLRLKDNLLKLKKLKNLTLSFEQCSSITDQAVEILSEFLAESTNLEKLSLNFANCYSLGDIAIEKLSQSLKKLIDLETLDLSFRTSKKAMHSLKHAILGMPLLKCLLLNFKWSKIEDEGIKELSYALQHARQLTRLYLSLGGIQDITHKALEYICQAMLQIKYISEADFWFTCCPNLTYETRREFKKTLMQQSKIDFLSVDYL